MKVYTLEYDFPRFDSWNNTPAKERTSVEVVANSPVEAKKIYKEKSGLHKRLKFIMERELNAQDAFLTFPRVTSTRTVYPWQKYY